jgi:hypothetical protein
VSRLATANRQLCTYPDPGRAISRSALLPWNSRRFRRTWRCNWCGRPATRAFRRPGQRRRWFSIACETCWQRERRAKLQATVLTPANRRLRWAIRCSCGQPSYAVSRGTEFIASSCRWPLEGECRACQQRDRVFSAWLRGFTSRRTLVRRNVPRSDLQRQLLNWVWDVEQARGNRTWRQVPDPPRGPDGGGGTRLTRRATLAELVDLIGSVA